MAKLLPVECAICGWRSRRKPGQLVQCTQCGEFAAFQEE